DDREYPEDERDPEHEGADAPDVVGIALGDAVIDDVGVEVGEVEVRDRLQEQERGDDRDLPPVRREVRSKQADQHRGLPRKTENMSGPTRRTPAPAPPQAG